MAEVTTDHDTIRKWAESNGGKPAAVDRTHQGGDVGIIRIMFPKNPQSEHGSLVEISWDEFFQEFDKRELALLYDERSLFSKIVGRDTAEKREHGDHSASRHAGRDDGKHGGSDRHGSEKQAGSSSGSAKQSGREGGGAEASKAGGARKAGEEKRSGSDEDRSLKEREYRDAQGNIHHHTRTFEEQHGRKGESR